MMMMMLMVKRQMMHMQMQRLRCSIIISIRIFKMPWNILELSTDQWFTTR